MTNILLDPTGEFAPVARLPMTKPADLVGLTIGLLDISKARGNVFLDRIANLLEGQGLAVRRYKKPTFTRPAPISLVQEIAQECDVVIEGLAD